ncbi:ESX-1 secretion-associated protein EspI-like [Palaemon carinicauda]|uniref:ESX-1 secretion-associated protein EspI-like n=1 Tax=Palaemon carinicauda TaxID=392227 RepID=UPI0035B5F795
MARSSAEETTRLSPVLPATNLDLSGDRSRSPSEDDRPSGHSDLSPRPSTSRAPDARDTPPDTTTAQSPGPSGLKGLERKTAPLALKHQAPPERSPVADATVPDLAPRRSPSGVRATVPAMRQGPPARPRPSASWRPPAVPDIRPGAHQFLHRRARSRRHLRWRTGAHRLLRTRRARLGRRAIRAHARFQLQRLRAHQRATTYQRVAQEAPKLARGRSRPPLGSPSRPHELAYDATAHDAPVTRPVPATCPIPVFKATKVTLQRTPERPHPTPCPAQPPQQRTPVRPHPDARHAGLI